MLQYGNYNCWAQNNVRAVPGRTFTGKKGLSDIIGYHRFTALFMVCEVKTDNDKLRPAQIIFLTEVTTAGGLALLAMQNEAGQVVLIEFKDWIEKQNPGS